MLFILTGKNGEGKTSWLCDFVKFAQKEGVGFAGVLAPGVWENVERTESSHNSHNDSSSNCNNDTSSNRSNDNAINNINDTSSNCNKPLKRKVAIENVLLPGGEKHIVATLKQKGWKEVEAAIPDDQKPTYNARKWFFDSQALEDVNKHFLQLKDQSSFDFLVVDELGPKELEFNEGLTNAVDILAAGPSERFKNAIVVVRTRLVDNAKEKFKAWGRPVVITKDQCFGKILEAIEK